jgi:hypothetical protein
MCNCLRRNSSVINIWVLAKKNVNSCYLICYVHFLDPEKLRNGTGKKELKNRA